MTVQFHRSNLQLDTLYWDDSRLVGYLLPSGASGPDTIDLADSWTKYDGCYLLVGEKVAMDPLFVGPVRTFLDAPGMEGTRFVWFARPNDPSGRLTGPTLTFAGPPDGNGTATLRVTGLFSFGGLDLVVTTGATVSPATDGFTIAPGNGSCYLDAPDGVQLKVVEGNASIDLAASVSAAINLQLQLGQTAGVDDLDHLDAGLRIFYPVPSIDAPAASSGADPVFVASYRYPLFAAAPLTVAASLDPNHPLDPTHTALRLTGTTAIPSRFVTNTGHAYSLTPTASSALVFAPQPSDTGGGPPSSLYLTPTGTFTLDRPGSYLMCGMSGVEYVKLPAVGMSSITFTPGGAAYASGHQDQPLSPMATTSWARVLGGVDPDHQNGVDLTYCAQPDAAVLHQPSNDEQNQFPALTYLEVPAETLKAAATGTYPLLPYDGVAAADATGARALEAGAVAPARRKAINAIGSASPAAADARSGGAPGPDVPTVSGTTPQGLLATFTYDFQNLVRVTLARNADGSEVALGGIPAGTAMWSALQCNQLFLVVSNPTSIAPYLAGPTALRADGWTFDLDPAPNGGWRPIDGDLPTFLILKFAGKALADLAAEPGSWAEATAFNVDPAAASAKLQAYVADSIAHAVDDPNLQWFASTVLQDPNWNGIVAVNCHTPIDGWPEQLQGLSAGIDPQKLVAHHAGVQVTPVTTAASGAMALQPSSIFGLINYRDPAPIPASPMPYDFKVTVLEVLLANSHVAGFAGQILLQANQLFGEAATCTTGTNNNLVFNGTYQSVNGQGSYAFLLANKALLTMTSAVVKQVELARAEFVTATKPGPSGAIETRFQLWGTMSFLALDGFDAFAFDTLTFAGLAIDMAVQPTGSPTLPASKVMTFDAGHLSFDLDQSTARPTSLYASFPLRLTGFVQAPANTKPTDLGYAPVSTPIQGAELGAPWFGLVMQLELGGQGAWAPAANFSAGALLAWGVSSGTQANVFTGLQLPGTTGGQLQMTLEGPIKLGLKNVSFQVKDGAYLLWMQSLALSFFGLTFPPGRTDILLFAKGDGSKTLGWYAVYDKGSSVQQAGGNQNQGGGQRQVTA